MKIAAYVLTFFCLFLNSTLFIRLNAPYNFYIVILPLLAGALAPILIVLGGVGIALSWVSGARIAFIVGLLSVTISVVYMILLARPQTGFAEAYGEDWETKISPAQTSRLLQRRWQPLLPQGKGPTFIQDVPFWTIPDSDRQLLSDIWLPSDDVPRSGVTFIFLHGSAWYLFDKDNGTRPLFRQLTAQGHVVMDVAYRLGPEVELYGMVGDAKRAVVWMKEHADEYGVDPERIVLGGASAGGHLALLAAYTPDHPELTPSELVGRDQSVHAVVSLYGPTDLAACYEHLNQARLIGMPKLEIGQPGAATMEKSMVDAGRLDVLLGGHLHEVPEMYALGSPITHVSENAPPTLLIQGTPDVITPIAATQALHDKLVANGVPVVNVVYPLTNHAFDLLFPRVSPPAQTAFYDLERFLALVE